MAEIVPSLLPAIEPIGEPLVMDPPGARRCINGCGAIAASLGRQSLPGTHGQRKPR
jgi:hypothetical protein